MSEIIKIFFLTQKCKGIRLIKEYPKWGIYEYETDMHNQQ